MSIRSMVLCSLTIQRTTKQPELQYANKTNTFDNSSLGPQSGEL